MQIPYRKPGKFSALAPDPLVTTEKFAKLQSELEELTKFTRPQAAAEVARLAELGDFSENAEYQLAKGRLRGINNRILSIENHLKQATIISPPRNADAIQLGHTATIEANGQQKTYQILGSSEINLGKGIISHNSPVGAALMGHRVGEVVKVKLAEKIVEYKIIEIK